MNNEKMRGVLEYGRVLEIASDYCSSLTAKQTFFNITPAGSVDEAENSLRLTEEAYIMMFEKLCNPVHSVEAIDEIAGLAKVYSVLSIAQLSKVLLFLKNTRLTKQAIEEFNDGRVVLLKKLVEELRVCIGIEDELDNCILSETELSDNASPKLKSLRNNIAIQKNRLKDKLDSFIRKNAKIMQDNIFTVRNDRYVVPIKSEFKGTVAGFLHDSSVTGATQYIEPVDIMEGNNKLKEAVFAEQEEVRRILAELTAKVSSITDILLLNQEIAVDIDIIFAKARYADSIKAVKPKFSNNGEFLLLKARHPLLSVEKVVPVDIAFSSSETIFLISGPNTGGKTVVLKTIGLFCLLSYSGFFIPAAAECMVPFYDNILCDIGDEQSIENELSTFSSRIKNITEILNCSNNSLLLFDELGAGTDPSEGAALAVAITKYLIENKIKSVITTHFSEMKELGMLNKSVKNASMEFDSITFLPTYRLKSGLPGVSNAVKIAAHLGLKEEIIKCAVDLLGEGKRRFEEVLTAADIAKTQALNEKEKLEALNVEQEKLLEEIAEEKRRLEQRLQEINNTAKIRIDRLVEKTGEQAEEILNKMQELMKEVNAANLLSAKQLLSSIDGLSAEEDLQLTEVEDIKIENLKVGQWVVVKKIGSKGTVKSLPDKKNEIEVAVGNLILKLNINEIGLEKYKILDKSLKNRKTAKYYVTHSTEKSVNSSISELKLLGKNVDEAIIEVDYFIDNSLSSGVYEVKIIHGLGTGALRKGLHNYFKTHKNISEFRLGLYGEGGAGVTILKLK